MKQKLFRAGCAALSLSLAAGLFTSCSILPQPSAPASHPEQEAPKDYDASSIQDDRLRILYNYNAVGGNTILCGDTILRQSPASETSYLVTDAQTGETNYYFVEWSDASAPSGRRCTLYDKTGSEVLSFDRDYDLSLSGGMLILRVPDVFAFSPVNNHEAGDIRVVDLATGNDLPVPENAYGCVAVGDYLAFSIYAPGDAEPDEENDDLYQYSVVQVQDKAGNIVYQTDRAGAAATSLSGTFGDEFVPSDWLEIDVYSADASYSIEAAYLLNPSTGEELPHFVRYCGNGTACFHTEDGGYQLVDLVSTENSTVLREFDQKVVAYAPGLVLLSSDGYSSYTFYDLTTGDTKDLLDITLGTNDLAFYAADGTLRSYESRTGALLTDETIEPVENLQRVYLTAEEDGWVWLRQYNNDDYEVTTSTVCGPNGVVKQMDAAALNERYNSYLSPLLTTEDGIYFSASYEGPNSTWLSDVLDSDGNVVIRGLAVCNGYYRTYANPLPDGVFVARKGFRYGWMDLSGNWIYCQSIFDSTCDDGTNYYF